ncbi:collagen alpha-1(I) chain-like [Antechinus flavipes]|uniref:collagen alpha-1(I) chain-like n=1 Tax=Antechinus flavipes TaxID=38775 RepID=UPI0022367A4F|nr:collagen alpha-1(I) chain-like [Antechinus flavipes]
MVAQLPPSHRPCSGHREAEQNAPPRDPGAQPGAGVNAQPGRGWPLGTRRRSSVGNQTSGREQSRPGFQTGRLEALGASGAGASLGGPKSICAIRLDPVALARFSPVSFLPSASPGPGPLATSPATSFPARLPTRARFVASSAGPAVSIPPEAGPSPQPLTPAFSLLSSEIVTPERGGGAGGDRGTGSPRAGPGEPLQTQQREEGRESPVVRPSLEPWALTSWVEIEPGPILEAEWPPTSPSVAERAHGCVGRKGSAGPSPGAAETRRSWCRGKRAGDRGTGPQGRTTIPSDAISNNETIVPAPARGAHGVLEPPTTARLGLGSGQRLPEGAGPVPGKPLLATPRGPGGMPGEAGGGPQREGILCGGLAPSPARSQRLPGGGGRGRSLRNRGLGALPRPPGSRSGDLPRAGAESSSGREAPGPEHPGKGEAAKGPAEWAGRPAGTGAQRGSLPVLQGHLAGGGEGPAQPQRCCRRRPRVRGRGLARKPLGHLDSLGWYPSPQLPLRWRGFLGQSQQRQLHCLFLNDFKKAQAPPAGAWERNVRRTEAPAPPPEAARIWGSQPPSRPRRRLAHPGCPERALTLRRLILERPGGPQGSRRPAPGRHAPRSRPPASARPSVLQGSASLPDPDNFPRPTASLRPVPSTWLLSQPCPRGARRGLHSALSGAHAGAERGTKAGAPGGGSGSLAPAPGFLRPAGSGPGPSLGPEPGRSSEPGYSKLGPGAEGQPHSRGFPGLGLRVGEGALPGRTRAPLGREGPWRPLSFCQTLCFLFSRPQSSGPGPLDIKRSPEERAGD